MQRREQVWAIEFQDEDGRWIELQTFPSLPAADRALQRLHAMRPARPYRLARKEIWYVEDGE